MISHKIDLAHKDRLIVEAVLKAHLPVLSRVGAFGSRTNGRARRGADLDLMVDAGRPLTNEETLALKLASEDSDLPIRVDIVDRWAIAISFWDVIKDEVLW